MKWYFLHTSWCVFQHLLPFSPQTLKQLFTKSVLKVLHKHQPTNQNDVQFPWNKNEPYFVNACYRVLLWTIYQHIFCYFCFIVTLVQKKHLFIKYLVCVSALHIQTCTRVVAQDLGVVLCLEIVDRGQVTEVCRQHREPALPRRRCTGIGLESEVKSQRGSSPLPHSISTDSNIAIYYIFYAQALHAIGTSCI